MTARRQPNDDAAELAKLLSQPLAPAGLERLMAVRGAVLPVQRQAHRCDAAISAADACGTAPASRAQHIPA